MRLRLLGFALAVVCVLFFVVWFVLPTASDFVAQSNPASTQQASVARQRMVQTPGDVPEGYQQILPRGGIPAIDDPQYVSADQAEISDGSFVLGVIVEDQPLAYSLNLLNNHEIVNDTVGETNFAAVW